MLTTLYTLLPPARSPSLLSSSLANLLLLLLSLPQHNRPATLCSTGRFR